MTSLRRIAVSSRLFLRDLTRQRLSLLLLFVVPALFDLVVLATTGRRDVDVTIAALVEEGATIRVNGAPEDPMDPGLLDNGYRTLDERSLSLVFLGNAAVCFLACFLAFNLVHKRRAPDERLMRAGLSALELLAAKLAVLGVLVLALGAYETAIVALLTPLMHAFVVAAAFFAGGVVYGCLGLLVGAVATHELEGVFTIVLLTNVDVGWLQNPIYYSTSQRRALIEGLPGHAPAQLAITAALTNAAAHGHLARALGHAAIALLLALAALRLRRGRSRSR